MPALAPDPGGGLAVTLVVVLYNAGGDIESFWADLAAQGEAGWRLIAIDNASRDTAASWLVDRADPRVTVLRNPSNVGYARAVNQGLRLALEGPETPIILMNTDVSFPPDFLARLLAARGQLAADVLAPRILHADKSEEAWYAGGSFEDSWLLQNVHETTEAADAPAHRLVTFASGCCLVLTPAVLRRVGLLDERFFVYWEDADFCLRLQQAGIPIHYVREPSLIHAPGTSSGGERSPAHARLFYRSYGAFLRKHRGLPYALRALYRIYASERARRPARDGGHPGLVARAMALGIAAFQGRA